MAQYKQGQKMISDFHFLRPYWLLAVIPLAFLLWRFWHRNAADGNWKTVCDTALLPHLLIGAGYQKNK